MANSIPRNVLTHLRQQSAAAHAEHLHEIKAGIQHSNEIVRLSMARQLDQPSPANAAAVSKILGLPK